MERLLYSSSPTSSLHCKPTLPRLPRITAAKLGGFPFLPRQPELRRFSYVSCKYESNPPPKSSVSRGEFPSLPPLQVDSSSGSVESSDLAEQIPAEASRLQRKVVNVAACVLLSAIFMFTMHPIFASPALATFQTAANTGAPGAGVGTKLIRTELLSSAWTGFFAGCLHTLSGPDHLAALAPLSIGRSRLESAAVGALWGCGHDAGQVIFGLLFLLLKDRLHIEILRTWGTRVVGITLLVIGGMGIKEASEVPTPCVALENGECDVSVYESAALDSSSPAVVGKKKKIGFATFATGIVHGLQPDALMMVLPALALPSRVAGAAFLVMFLVGTVIAMGCYTVFIGSCSEALKDRVPRITEKLTWASSLIAITLGVAILISQFFGFSLY
ncbi:Chloroplast protein FOR GROWTH AND FERTILITY 2 [Linum perenne]